MLDPGGDEEDVSRTEGMTGSAVDELPASCHHYVKLVSVVRRLRVNAPRGVQLQVEGPSLQGQDEALALRAWEALHCLCDSQMTAILCHASSAG